MADEYAGFEFGTDSELTYFPLTSLEEGTPSDTFDVYLVPDKVPYDQEEDCVDLLQRGRGMVARVHAGDTGWERVKEACDSGRFDEQGDSFSVTVLNQRERDGQIVEQDSYWWHVEKAWNAPHIKRQDTASASR